MWALSDVAFIGNNKYTVGNDLYFADMNKGVLQTFLHDEKRYDYFDSLENAAERMIAVFDELYGDLRDNISVIMYTDNSNRKDFIHILESFIGICKLVSKSTGKAKECISILNLTDSAEKTRSRLSDSSINDKMRSWERFDGLSSGEKQSIANKILYDGGINERHLKEKERQFLEGVSDSLDEEVIYDVAVKYLYKKDKNIFKGKCGKEICSREYFDYMVGKVFSSHTNMSSSYETYDKQVESHLKEIAKNIESDLDIRHITVVNRAGEYKMRLLKVADDIDRLIGTNLKYAVRRSYDKVGVVDVTDRFNAFMREQDSIYRSYLSEKTANREGNAVDANIGFPKLSYFISQVKTYGPIDLKNLPDWPQGCYIYDGEIRKTDDLGNMLFGYVGKIFGYDDDFLCFGAGIYQIISGTSSKEFLNSYSYGDDPRDTEMIRRGIEIYKNCH